MSVPVEEGGHHRREPRQSTLYRGHRRDSFMPLDKVELVELRARQRTFEGAWQRTALVNLGYGAVVLKVFDRRFFSIGILYTIIGLLLVFISLHRRKDSNHAFSDAFPNRWDGPSHRTPTPWAPSPRFPSSPRHPPADTDAGQVTLTASPTLLSGSHPPISPTTRQGATAFDLPSPSVEPLPPQAHPLPEGPTRGTGQPTKEASNATPAPKDLPPGPRIYGAPFVTAGGVVLLFGAVVGLMEIALFVLVMRI